MGFSPCHLLIFQGLKPGFLLLLPARVNSCPDTKPAKKRVFQQPVKPISV